MISRLGNLIVNAVSVQTQGKLFPFPKIVVVVPDDDIIKLLQDVQDQITDVRKTFGRLLNYVMMEHERSISAFKEHLGARSIKAAYPQILWIQAPTHDNFANNALRHKFNKSLEDISKFHANTSSLMLKHVWDPTDKNLFIEDCQRFTNEGLRIYREAVDRTVRYFDSVILKKQERVKNLKKSRYSSPGQKDRFKWCNPRYNIDEESENVSFHRLPVPPPSNNFKLKHRC